jgi:hypothetical protein
LTSDRKHTTPHLDAGTTTGSTRTKNPNGVPGGQPHPADSTTSAGGSQPSEHEVCAPHGGRRGSTLPNLPFQIKATRRARRSGACSRSAMGRTAPTSGHGSGASSRDLTACC